MQKNTMAIVLIILGIIVLAVPLLGLIPLSILTGLGVVFLGIGFILAGFPDREINRGLDFLKLF